MRLLISVVAALAALLAGLVFPVAGMAAVRPGSISVHVPAVVRPGRPFVVRVVLPPNVAAVDGRLLLDTQAVEVWGLAPVGGGTAMRPEPVPGGVAFGAYDLHPVNGATTIRLILDARRAAQVQVGVAVDALADRAGHRLPMGRLFPASTIDVGGGTVRRTAPVPTWDATPLRTPGPARDLLADGRLDRQDLDATRIGWDTARVTGSICGPASRLTGDANGDGCVDVVDLQAELAAQGLSRPAAAAVTGNLTFTVVSTADTPDAAPGNGICANASGQCTLRAAMNESNFDIGNDRIEFNLAGTAPVTIQIGNQLPSISSRSGTMTIDGYTQPGSHVNTATFGSNAVPGVEIRGPGVAAATVGIYITSFGNTLRGLVLSEINRPVFIDHVDAHDNHVVGDWIGFGRDGTPGGRPQYAVLLNSGANHNVIGTPLLADRNVLYGGDGVNHYGLGTESNLEQNNQMCIGPSGFIAAQCQTGIDHNFGPKNNIAGGSGPNERNVIGPTGNQGMEYSHGWNPVGPHGAIDPTWQISGNQAIGNWIGFRGDGSYDPAFRSGQTDPGTGDNGNGINCYDGSNNNVMDSNYIGSVFDGIQVMSGNAQNNIVRNNIIGTSPLGQPAPLTRWGIKVRITTKHDVIQGNTISNAALGGIGLVQNNVLNIRITQNIVTNTNGPAIDLFGIAGPDPNDPGDVDEGANHLLNTPVFTSAKPALISGTGVPNGTVEVYLASRPVGQFGLPVAYVGSTTVAPGGTWNLAAALPNATVVTALQIDPSGNTSELAANTLVGDAPPPPPPPQPGDLLASDNFERTVAGAWGTAVMGGTWSLIGNSGAFSVGGGNGLLSIAANQTREARLAIGATDVNMTGTVSFDRLPAGGNAFAYVSVRASATSTFRTTIRVATTGAVFSKLTRVVNNAQSDVAPELSTGLTAAPGVQLAFRFRLVATHLQFRIWPAAGVEPSTWLKEADDTTPTLQGPGGVGLRGFADATVTNGPILVSFDSMEVRVP
jgi:CSLREA domain-containing protein